MKPKLSAPLPPGPAGKPIVGVLGELKRENLLTFMTRCRDYGDVVRIPVLHVRPCMVYHPDHIEYILSKNARNFTKPASMRSKLVQRLLGNGLFTSEGDLWRKQRRLMQPAFHRQRISTYADVTVEYAQRLVASWKEAESRNIHAEMMRVTLEIVVKVLFDVDVSIAGTSSRVGELSYEIIRPFGDQGSFQWFFDNYLPTSNNRKFHKASQELDDIIFPIISDRRKSGRDEGDLLSMLLQAQDEDGSEMTDTQLRDEIMTLFLAGHETSALVLTWAWYLLACHPEVEQKFHAEIDEVCGGRAPTFADLPLLKYTDMITREVMRLYPPLYGFGRQAIEECEIGGYRIPAGTEIFAFPYVTQRDKRFFTEPEQFLPERWTEEFSRNLSKYAYFPFGGGPRMCIGNTFAAMELTLVLATIGQKIRLRYTDGPMDVLPGIVLQPKRILSMTIEKRAKNS